MMLLMVRDPLLKRINERRRNRRRCGTERIQENLNNTKYNTTNGQKLNNIEYISKKILTDKVKSDT